MQAQQEKVELFQDIRITYSLQKLCGWGKRVDINTAESVWGQADDDSHTNLLFLENVTQSHCLNVFTVLRKGQAQNS